MATEAQYAEMWVQDAITMTTYQAAATAAAVLQPLTPATPTTNPAAAGTQARGRRAATTAASPATALGRDLSRLARRRRLLGYSAPIGQPT